MPFWGALWKKNGADKIKCAKQPFRCAKAKFGCAMHALRDAAGSLIFYRSPIFSPLGRKDYLVKYFGVRIMLWYF